MDHVFDSRRMLGISVGVAAASALGTVGAPEAHATALTGRSTADPLPPVPGMLGNRRANELWYQFDKATYYEAAQEFKDAWAAVKAHLGCGDAEMTLVGAWMDHVRSGDYPGGYVDLMRPVREAPAVISRTQLSVFDRNYRHDLPGLMAAFADFGEGVLYDPRTPGVHTMNGVPAPAGYHV